MLDSLLKLQKLQSLLVTKTNVSLSGVANFRKLKPSCKTFVGDGQADPLSQKLLLRITSPTTYQPEFVDLILQEVEGQFKVEQELSDGLLLSPIDLDLRSDSYLLNLLRYQIEQGLAQIKVSIEAV